MTEYNIFCYSKEFNDENSFQQKRYRAFNKEVGKERYNEIVGEVGDILGEDFVSGSDKKTWEECWEQVTSEQWKKLLAIPEAKNFKEGFEFITGIEIDIEKNNKKQELLDKADELIEKAEQLREKAEEI